MMGNHRLHPLATAETEVLPAVAPAPTPRQGWAALGRAPEILLLSSLGVVLVALAYHGGRTGHPYATAAYWAGHAVVFVPVAARVLARRLVGATEAFVLVMGLAVNQYLLKWMYSPDQFRFPDELQHWAGTTTALETGQLFRPNPALPIAAEFPGLQEMGAAVAATTGLPVTTAGFIVAGLTRLIFVGALFILTRRAGGSPALAGAACVIYATGLHYLFFNSMYLYQTAALPFLLLAVWAALAWRPGGGVLAVAIVGVTAICVATVSHHVTAIITVATLLLLALSEVVFGRGRRRRGAIVLAGAAILVVGAWFALAAQDLTAYFEPSARRFTTALQAALGGGGSTSDAAAVRGPLWELALQAAGLLVLLVLFIRMGYATVRARSRDPWQWAILIGAAAFFAGNGLRLLGSQGPELAGRASTFTYVPMALLAAAAVVERHRGSRPPVLLSRPVVIGTALATLLMLGARAGGWPPRWERLPGPHLVGGFERSIDKEGVTAAGWTRGWLGRGHRVSADITGWILLASYGRQVPVGETAPAYYAPEWGLDEARLLDDLAVDYLWVDLRMSSQTPAAGAYFFADPEAGEHREPLPRESLTKFDALPRVDLVYDSGSIRIYDVRDL